MSFSPNQEYYSRPPQDHVEPAKASPSERPIDRVLRHLDLDGARRSNGYLMVRCPAHRDDNPSLKVDESGGGKVIVHCFAGCEFDAIVTAMGLEKRDFFPDNRATFTVGKQRRSWQIKDAGGEVQATHVRVDEGGESF